MNNCVKEKCTRSSRPPWPTETVSAVTPAAPPGSRLAYPVRTQHLPAAAAGPCSRAPTSQASCGSATQFCVCERSCQLLLGKEHIASLPRSDVPIPHLAVHHHTIHNQLQQAMWVPSIHSQTHFKAATHLSWAATASKLGRSSGSCAQHRCISCGRAREGVQFAPDQA